MKRAVILSGFLASLAGCGENLTVPMADAGTDGGVFTCLPNLDGKIEASELKAVLNAPVNYLVGNNRTVNLAGKDDGQGHLIWDFSQDFADDGYITIQAWNLNDKWYQELFPDGHWSAPIDALATTDGVYSADDEAIYLLGLVSAAEPKKDAQNQPIHDTLAIYDKKVAVYRFPLLPGSSWTAVGNVKDGYYRGVKLDFSHTYEITDDGLGRLDLHTLSFEQAHRIRTTLTMKAGATSEVKRQTGFVFECFGEVTRATSDFGEANDDFTTAAELRRLEN